MKSPFDVDQEDQQMIKLDTFVPMTSFSSTPITKPIVEQIHHEQINTSSSASMFDQQDTHFNLNKPPSQLNQNDDPPLLQDIGIDLELIKKRIIAVSTIQQGSQDLVSNPDLSGPIIIALALGFLLLLGGKIHFSDIQSAFILGNIFMYFMFNFMNKTIPLYNIMSFLGYALIPLLLLAALGVIITLKSQFGIISSMILSIWAAASACNLISVQINRTESKILVAYPLFIFYLSFALIIIF